MTDREFVQVDQGYGRGRYFRGLFCCGSGSRSDSLVRVTPQFLCVLLASSFFFFLGGMTPWKDEPSFLPREVQGRSGGWLKPGRESEGAAPRTVATWLDWGVT